jgi:hypothetical protein
MVETCITASSRVASSPVAFAAGPITTLRRPQLWPVERPAWRARPGADGAHDLVIDDDGQAALGHDNAEAERPQSDAAGGDSSRYRLPESQEGMLKT